MKIRLLSDLHLEFEIDEGTSFIDGLDPSSSDILVLAGDITVGALVPAALRKFCAKWPHVVYVPGNHEYYRGDLAMFRRRSIDDVLPHNLTWFGQHGHVYARNGVLFTGATLWFPRRERTWHLRKNISDFNLIDDADRAIPAAHRNDLYQLRNSCSVPDVVVTHHLPCAAAVSPRYRGSLLNDFFEADQEVLVRELHPKFWLHGHTHDSVDVMVGETRVVCNPRGYWPDSLNPNFDPNYTLVL